MFVRSVESHFQEKLISRITCLFTKGRSHFSVSTAARNFYELAISEVIFRFIRGSAPLNAPFVRLHLLPQLQCTIIERLFITDRGRRLQLTEDESNLRKRQNNNKVNVRAPRKKDVIMSIFFIFYRSSFNCTFQVTCAFNFSLLFGFVWNK